MEQRVFHAATDISTKVNDFRAGVHTFNYTLGQFLYIGSILPFNNLWFELGVLNIVPATVTVEIWYGGAWTSAVDVIDETTGLTETGRISWNTDLGKSWDLVEESKNVTGLPAGSRIFDMYWCRLSWSATLTTTTTLKYIGQKFATDGILYGIYPDLNNDQTKLSFASGKTNWDEQHYIAAEEIVKELKKRGVIKARQQIMDYKMFENAACRKIAEIVYTAFGAPYFDQLKLAKDEFSKAMNIEFPAVDQNADGTVSSAERAFSMAFGRR